MSSQRCGALGDQSFGWSRYLPKLCPRWYQWGQQTTSGAHPLIDWRRFGWSFGWCGRQVTVPIAVRPMFSDMFDCWGLYDVKPTGGGTVFTKITNSTAKGMVWRLSTSRVCHQELIFRICWRHPITLKRGQGVMTHFCFFCYLVDWT